MGPGSSGSTGAGTTPSRSTGDSESPYYNTVLKLVRRRLPQCSRCQPVQWHSADSDSESLEAQAAGGLPVPVRPLPVALQCQ